MKQATIEKNQHLLDIGPGHTPDEYWAASAAFINACCWDEKAVYRLYRKTGGTHCTHPNSPIDCDKVVDKNLMKMYDMVVGGGAYGQSPGMSEVGGADAAMLIMPVDPVNMSSPPPVSGGTGGTVPFHPYDGDDFWTPVTKLMEKDYQRSGRVGLDGECGMWIGRTIHDCYMGPDASQPPMSREDSVKKHRAEWCALLGIPVNQPTPNTAEARSVMTVGELKLKLKSLEPDTRVRVRLVEPAAEAPAPYGRPKRALKPGELDKWEKKEHDRIDKLPAKERAAAKEQLAQDLAAKQADDNAMWEKKERERISQLPANERKDAEAQLAKDLAAESGAKEAGDKGGPYDIATILSVSTPNGTTVELALSLETGSAAEATGGGDPQAAAEPKPTAEPV